MADHTGRIIQLVAEIKHPTHFASIGLPLDDLLDQALGRWNRPDRLIVECFEQNILMQLKGRGIEARYVYLLESKGSAPDLVASFGRKALPYSAQLTSAGLARLARDVDGISVDKNLLLSVTDGTVTDDRPRRARARGRADRVHLDPASREPVPRSAASRRQGPARLGRLAPGVRPHPEHRRRRHLRRSARPRRAARDGL